MAAGDSISDGDPLARHALSASELKALMATERSGEAFLAFRDGHGALQLFTVAERGDSSTLGRRAETDLSISWDEEVSGLHAELQHVAGEWTIVDDGLSRNGTYVDGQRVNGRQRLRDGSRIRVGRTTLAYRAAQATGVGETVMAASDRPAISLTDTQRKVLIALCRPYRDGGFGTPATNQQIASEVFLSVDAVKMHLRTLFSKFGLADLAQNQKRTRLAEDALRTGAISHRELV
jgi:pSer/pThr/pTyr-binding forkhead associated (FHA) protein